MKHRWKFFQGDIKQNLNNIPQKIETLLMDSDHSELFAEWYIHNIFPKVTEDAPIAVHDIMGWKADDKNFKDGENLALFDFFKKNKISYFTAAQEIPQGWTSMNERINKLRITLGIENVQQANTNSMVFFLKLGW